MNGERLLWKFLGTSCDYCETEEAKSKGSVEEVKVEYGLR